MFPGPRGRHSTRAPRLMARGTREPLEEECAEAVAVRRWGQRLFAERRILLEQSRSTKRTGNGPGVRPREQIDRLRLQIEARVRATREHVELRMRIPLRR